MSRQFLDRADVFFLKKWAADKSVEFSTSQYFSALAKFSHLVVSYLACLEKASTLEAVGAWVGLM